MKLLVALSVFGLMSGVFAGECKYSRKGGLFLNDFEDSTDPEFGGALETDSDNAKGDFINVTFVNALDILGVSTNTLRVYDDGVVILDDSPHIDFTGQAAGDITDFPFVASRWFVTAAINYQVSVEFLNRSEIVDSSGNVVKSLCTLERIEAIISDCKGSTLTVAVEEYGLADKMVLEAAIITFNHSSAGEETLHQLVVAQTQTETYVLCLYEDSDLSNFDSLMCNINGLYATAANTQWSGYCPAANGSIHELSNCDCGSWNTGVYVFNTAAGCTDPFAAENTCDTAMTSTVPHYQRNINCRPAMEPLDTCREDLVCKMSATGGTGFSMTLYFRDNPLYTEVVFLDQMEWIDNADIVIRNFSHCMGTIVDGEVTFDFDASTAVDCDVTMLDNGTVDFIVMTRDANETQDLFIKDGYRVLKANCNYQDLVSNVTLSPEFGTFGNESIDTPAGRTVDLFVSTEYRFTTDPVTTKLPANEIVYLGQDLFLTLCYEQGERPFQVNAEPYGAWPSDCYVSNDETFPDDSNTIKLTNEEGCRMPHAKTTTNAFYIQQEFKMTSSQNSRLEGNNYEWCMSSGKFDAAKWVKSDMIYFKCFVNYCKNTALRDSAIDSKCMAACDGTLDNEARRKRAIEDDVKVVETSVRVVPSPNSQESEVECTDTTTAIATLVVLLVLLLPAAFLTMMLVMKLHTRERKRYSKSHGQ